MINVSGAFRGFQQSIVLKATIAGTRDLDTGAFIPGTTTPTTIKAVVQVATSDDLLVLPEGERTKKTIKVHSISEMKTASEDEQVAADLIEYQGEEFKVMSDFNRFTLGGYYKVLAVRTKTL